METHDQRNTRSLWLTALAALVVLILLSWWVLGRSSSRRAPVVAESSGVVDVAESATLTTAVDAYVQFVQGPRAHDAMAVDHTFTVTGIRNLAAALEAIASAGGPDVQRELTALREQAGALQHDARAADHADRARELFITLSGLMTSIQEARFPAMREEVEDVRRVAQGIDPASPLLDQPNAVQAFFDRSAAAVRRMSSAGGA